MKKMIAKTLALILSLVLPFMLFMNFMFRIWIVYSEVEEKSADLFWQIEQLIKINTDSLEQIKADLSNDCLIRAKMAAYVAQHYPVVIESVEESRRVADLLQVDEIHYFSEDGEIYAGTHPEYYHFNFDSGEQMRFFRPMLSDRTLELCQDITPNTAEGKPMQYAAVWREDGTGIVQIGLRPERVFQAMENRSISDIFAAIPIESGVNLYAIDLDSRKIIGCTNNAYIGRNAEELGFHLDNLSTDITITRSELDGEHHLCAVKLTADSMLLARTRLEASLILQVWADTGLLVVHSLALSVITIVAIYFYLDKTIVSGILRLNRQLNEIARGDSNTVSCEESIPEMSELRRHINAMLKSVMDSVEKVSIALELSKLPIGIYEYTPGSRRVLATARVKDILMLTDEAYSNYLKHPELIPAWEEQLSQYAKRISENVYELPGAKERYIQFESFVYGKSHIAILIDVTKTVNEKLCIEHERDTDPLTKLYNRRAFLAKVEPLFSPGAQSGYGAMLLIDADRLKYINDSYGHSHGDGYLRKIADILSSYEKHNAIVARLGGDEFVLYFHGYTDKEPLCHVIEELSADRDSHTFKINDEDEVLVQFSIGIAFYPEGGHDYHALMKLADERMYQDKKQRRQRRGL